MGYGNPLQNEYESSRHNEGPWCDDCHGYTHMPYCSSYCTDNEISDNERWRVDPYASCDIILDSGDGRASYLENRVAQVFGDSKEIRARRAESIVRNHNQHQQHAAQLRFLGNRAEELSSLLAGMTTERDGLRGAIEHFRARAIREAHELAAHVAQELTEQSDMPQRDICNYDDYRKGQIQAAVELKELIESLPLVETEEE